MLQRYKDYLTPCSYSIRQTMFRTQTYLLSFNLQPAESIHIVSLNGALHEGNVLLEQLVKVLDHFHHLCFIH